jgi:hypothetical protein
MSAVVEFRYWGLTAYIDDDSRWTSPDPKMTALLQQSCDFTGAIAGSPNPWWEKAKWAAEHYDGVIVDKKFPPPKPPIKGPLPIH